MHRLVDAQPRSPDVAPGPSGAPGTERNSGLALQVAASLLHEDANNPRTEFPDAEIDELAEDIRVRGILQPIVVHPADESGHYQIHFGAKRLRAALRAGLDVVPVVVRDAAADPYAAVAENQKRHNLSPLDLARFIKGRVRGTVDSAIAALKNERVTSIPDGIRERLDKGSETQEDREVLDYLFSETSRFCRLKWTDRGD